MALDLHSSCVHDPKMSEALFRKRPRVPTMTRTTSMKEFSPLISIPTEFEDAYKTCRISTVISTTPKGLETSLNEVCQKPESGAMALGFLHSCGTCRRLLGSGRDIYIYRGDSAFCSQECREQHIKQEARKRSSTSLSNS
ncbi:hypothetical protein J5N97_003665 [Dioscorea zingiberensis]|uniref:FLZ-type domain-containing protein n=1 Tax=Dioscorea zingiberensis TaxID=325984 RepID=A0A9D5HQM4_9LILI|nr:hypothetical protein J5N97_003665 [Dioscorea zingiberensis]